MAPPQPARFLTLASLGWVLRHRAYTWTYLRFAWRFWWWRLRHRHVVTEGFVFLGRGVTLDARAGYGRLVLGRWVHVGDGTRILAHGGSVRVGDKCVFGTGVTVTAYLDIEIGSATLVADDVYVTDFDHIASDRTRPIKDQGIVTSPVRIGPGCWLGTKSAVLRGVAVGEGVVIGAGAVVKHDLPDHAVAVGVPARVVRVRD